MTKRRKKKHKLQKQRAAAAATEEASHPPQEEERRAAQEEIETLLSSIVDETSVSNRKQPPSDSSTLPSIQRLRLEAIFYPKFENENQTEQDIRERMVERVKAGTGYLEASLKHSGSLLLWSGGQRFYSKNATDNCYTFVGEILLRQHFVRSWWYNNKDDHEQQPLLLPDDSESTNTILVESQYQECSQYIQEHRLTLAFEVITAVLGDHGDRPKRDFMILTAIGDRRHERFYSTQELHDFCHQFRLPHNDSWVFGSATSVQALFDLYDKKREVGLAHDVVESLTEAADAVVSSMYPHEVFQGDILEGIVIRYVPSPHKKTAIDDIHRLGAASKRLNSNIPVDLPDCHELVQGFDGVSPVLTTNVRPLFRETRFPSSGNNGSSNNVSFEKTLRDILASDGPRRRVVRVPKSWHADMPKLTESLVAQQSSHDDVESRRISTLLQSLKAIRKRIVYSVIRETLPAGESDDDVDERWLCIIHVIHDQTFQKYRTFADKTDMSLFRGFVVELSDVESSEPSNNSANVGISGGCSDSMQGPNDTLMLKMKLLPYMVRTFCCRNGLGVLKSEGSGGFVRYTNNLLSKWGISNEARRKWQPFFRAWAGYARERQLRKLPGERDLPQLSQGFYLDHLERFLEKYDAGKELYQVHEDFQPEEESQSETGLLVFVPGIVGCGKSTLLGSITTAELKKKLPSNRNLIVRMGDLTKGRYWQVVKNERLQDPSSVYIADKNAPGSTAWGHVADVCASTRTLGVPLVPDSKALHTTRVVGLRKPDGTCLPERVHIYPFSLSYLAVCMARILSRPSGSHPGKLDRSTPRAAFVAIKFFSLFRRISADDFLKTMRHKFESRGAQLAWSHVEVPFFRESAPALPRDLVELLMEALQVQLGYDLAKVDVQDAEDPYIADLDKRLNRCVEKHRDVFTKMTVDEATSREAFVAQILERVNELDSTLYSFQDNVTIEPTSKQRYVRLASVDVAVNAVHALLCDLLAKDERLESFAKMVFGNTSPESVLLGTRCPDQRFVSNTHVTLAFCRNIPQDVIRTKYGPIAGHSVRVQPTALLWSDRVAAFEVSLSDTLSNGEGAALESMNEFTHITVWCEKGTSAVQANELPDLVEHEKARRIDISTAVSLAGTVSLSK